ncbi:(2Fe-2S)-binding protein [Novosphingobium fuchskuhlense]|uniref:(2Fe-2S)-binding protein n=1 Tax=Novosphingobium fuchskuhlense TaxID=1117702 RepID=A0A117UW48_9SPHN|nr:aromatic ring-hydroxylating dioxygenase subunit alpha [Novosphingobium fuchskuhlense]KUR71979.1 (2Fe-2S)-binding protein [Novosphingobium fuchskuhlense]
MELGAQGYLRNAWYVADWADAITSALTPLEILGTRVVLTRAEDGSAIALEDACPHRKLPLSLGRRDGDTIVCGYHGLTFDRTGTCIAAPTQAAPPQTCVRAYPLAERYGLVWIWLGDPAAADPALILDIPQWGSPDWGYNRGPVMHVACHYLHVVDNLLDPTHVTWVHPGSFGDASCAAVPIETVSAPDGVTAARWLLDTEPAPFYAKFLKFAGRADRHQHYEVRYPSHAVIKAVFVPTGTGGHGRPLHPAAFCMDSFNFLTPVNARETRYFWFQLRDFAPDDAAVSAAFTADVQHAFEEDRVILNAVQIGLDTSPTPTVDLKNDLASFRFRAALARMIAAEG